jgi:hypothetical protein
MKVRDVISKANFLKEMLAHCSAEQQATFHLAFVGGVDELPVDKLDAALGVVERTMRTNLNARPERIR